MPPFKREFFLFLSLAVLSHSFFFSLELEKKKSMATPNNPQAAALAASLVKLARTAIALGVGGSIVQSSLYTGEF